ncbi:hypothetical protein L1049_007524 [Liquidambar formosana]|uniref:Uncharacterized protein n=1 Tax=Liquidambar formosana TaxID=63359 RepID=A0AAP0S930_LIQFO
MEGEMSENLLSKAVGTEGDVVGLKEKIWNESKKLWVVAGPAIFTRFSTFGVNVISQAFIGQIGSTELAAYALVFTVFIRFANGILVAHRLVVSVRLLNGVAVGAGWQSIVAYVNIACYYLVGIPIGVVLGYVFNMQVKGVWIGMLFGVLVQTVVLVIITYRTDWDKQVSIAQKRTKKWFVADIEEPNPNEQDV